MRHPYQMRTVVEKFRKPLRSDPSITVPFERLDCGHECRDRDDTYGNETAVQIRALMAKVGNLPVRRRCYACGRAKAAAEVRRE